MHNRKVKNYHHYGELKDDKDIPRLRNELERLMVQEMRDEGYLPIYELGPFWSTKYNQDGKKYEYKLSMYAWYAGTQKSKEFDLWVNGRLMKVG